MAIILPEIKVFTHDQRRAQYMAQHRTFTKKVEDIVLELVAHHRPSYEALLFKRWWDDIQHFIESRQPNETPYDGIVRQKREQQRVDYDRESRAKERMHYLSRYTTLPEFRWSGDARSGIDFSDHQDYGGYARQGVSRSNSGWTVSGGSVSPASNITFPAATASTNETETYWGSWQGKNRILRNRHSGEGRLSFEDGVSGGVVKSNVRTFPGSEEGL